MSTRAGVPVGAAAPPRWAELPPAAGAAVMATGIVSIGLWLIGPRGLTGALSGVLFLLAALLWFVLAAGFAARLTRDRARWRSEADTPPALTAVAATCVLGVRVSNSGWQALAAALLVLAMAVWPVLLVSVMRNWHRGMPGAAFLVCVATQAPAVLAAELAAAGYGDWLARAALVLFLLGLLLYLEALVRFDFRQIAEGSGDHWIAGGALAICALAASRLLASPLWTGPVHDALRVTTLLLIVLELAWYVVLMGAEVRWRRTGYDLGRWSTVFPLGMAAVACLSAAETAGVEDLRVLGELLLWIALGAWLLTATGLVLTGTGRRGPRATGGPRATD
ncbi:tellurite resistance/C4-dicarboxylate transporter family protein [Streptomyces sp. NPDC090022]|uniref:tellurite resistance/C4-dicarboxylate transporter family protein n=1 Tax=Streptomyces sp. NPDC090022 TaxID=3365920 RepID=UPI0037F6A953